jgi:hypothetical protein
MTARQPFEKVHGRGPGVADIEQPLTGAPVERFAPRWGEPDDPVIDAPLEPPDD